jgi:hypothetical protein
MTNAEPIKVTRQQVEPLVRATFPDYRGRKLRVEARTSVSLQDLNWSGGSRTQYRACTLDGQPTGNSNKYHAMAPWDSRQVEGQSLPVPSGFAVVRHTIFCGKDLGLTVTINPADMPRLLPAA